MRGLDLYAEQFERERREPEGDDVAPSTATGGRDRNLTGALSRDTLVPERSLPVSVPFATTPLDVT